MALEFFRLAKYGALDEGKPIVEGDPKIPSSPYAISKLAINQLTEIYHKHYNSQILTVRPFFVIGPEKEFDVCSDFAKRVANLDNNISTIKVGNLEGIRDFIDIRDAVNAICLVTERGTAGESYNICTGIGHKLIEIVENYRTFSNKNFTIESDPELFRPLEEKIKIGDPTKLFKLGWSPKHSFEGSLKTILSYWNKKINK